MAVMLRRISGRTNGAEGVGALRINFRKSDVASVPLPLVALLPFDVRRRMPL
jgi:hypothetical protein